MAETPARVPPPISLLDLATSSNLQPLSSLNSRCFQGYLVSPPLYDTASHTCTIMAMSPRPSRAMAILETAGPAGKAISEKLNMKDKVCWKLEGSQLEEIEPGTVEAAIPCVRIRFKQGVAGWIQRKLNEDEFFTFDNDEYRFDKEKTFDNSQELPQNSLPTPPRQGRSPLAVQGLHRSPSPETYSANKRRRSQEMNLAPSEEQRFAPKTVSKQTTKVSSNSKLLVPLSRLHVPTGVLDSNQTVHSHVIAQTRQTALKGYGRLVDVKRGVSGRIMNCVVVVVGIGEVSGPRHERDPYCARFDVTDLSISPTSEETKFDSLESIVELQWYAHDQGDIPPFQRRDVVFLRSISRTNHKKPQLRCIRRYDNDLNTLTYLSVSSSFCLDPRRRAESIRERDNFLDYLRFRRKESDQPAEMTGNPNRPREKLSADEWNFAIHLAKSFEGKQFPPPDHSFKLLREQSVRGSHLS